MASSNQGDNKGGKGGNQQSGDTSNRGFASMDPQKQREIASEGGRAAHASGNAHEFDSEEARQAGRMSHKNDGSSQSASGQGSSGGTRGGTSQQHAEAGRQSHKNDDNQQSGSGGSKGGGSSGGTRGGTPEQHAEAGRQSHKNDKG